MDELETWVLMIKVFFHQVIAVIWLAKKKNFDWFFNVYYVFGFCLARGEQTRLKMASMVNVVLAGSSNTPHQTNQTYSGPMQWSNFAKTSA